MRPTAASVWARAWRMVGCVFSACSIAADSVSWRTSGVDFPACLPLDCTGGNNGFDNVVADFELVGVAGAPGVGNGGDCHVCSTVVGAGAPF